MVFEIQYVVHHHQNIHILVDVFQTYILQGSGLQPPGRAQKE